MCQKQIITQRRRSDRSSLMKQVLSIAPLLVAALLLNSCATTSGSVQASNASHSSTGTLSSAKAGQEESEAARVLTHYSRPSSNAKKGKQFQVDDFQGAYN